MLIPNSRTFYKLLPLQIGCLGCKGTVARCTSRDEALLALEPEFKRMNILHKMERFKKVMSNNLSILFESMSTIGIVGKSERVHPICDVLLQRG